MSFAHYNHALKEARRDALVSHYLTKHDFGNYQGKINTADDLYDYLLLDTKISDSVTTSPLSEAVNSLQMCIHRAIEGYDDELVNTIEVNGWFAQDAFLDNWDRYNKRFSTWAGKEKLRFYAGNYVDPSLRMSKTLLFNELENKLNQGRLTNALAATALDSYVAGYDRYSNMKHLYAGNGNADHSRLYLTGESNGQYYWREVQLLSEKPIYWGDWNSLPASIDSPLEDKVVMANKDGVITCEWVSLEKLQDKDNTKIGMYHRWILSSDGGWEQALRAPYVTFLVGGDVLDEVWSTTRSMSYSLKNKELELSGTIVLDEELKTITFFVKEATKHTYLSMGVGGENLHSGESAVEKYYPGMGTIIYSWLSVVSSMTPEIIGGVSIYPRVDHYIDYYGKIINDFVYDTFNKKKFSVAPPTSTKNLNSLLHDGIANLLNYNKQKTISESGTWYYDGQTEGGDAFSGPYGLYLWEIFFHIPYLIATRFTTEQRFDEAERWYKYIFNSVGYRDEDGKILTDGDGKTPRYWNCYPLQQDSAWDELVNMPASTDPDSIAMADPMHYKYAIFLHTLDLLINRGDAAYRMLERDTLTEAKMFYIQAQQLLGPRPDIRITNTWNNPTLEKEAVIINKPATRDDMPQTFAQWLRAGDRNEMGDGDFLPPYNDVLLTYWDKIDVRLFNLRHNLSLTGQPLDLPLFSTPADPVDLHRQQSGGDGVQSDASRVENIDTGWRYPLLADHARNATSQLTQFGSGLLSALERRDSEQLTQLLQTQQITVLNQQQDIAQKNLDSLSASLTSLNTSLASAQMRKNHYTQLIAGNLSAQEQAGLTLRTTSRAMALMSQGMTSSGGAMSAFPNTFGLANGGGDLGAPLRATGLIMQMVASANEQSAVISDISAGYKRRLEEWNLQCDLADKDVEQMHAQIDSLKGQITMQQKQILLTETESANAQALYDLQTSRFTGQALYNWMVGRLSGLYYQLYDATVPVCLQARNALRREFGKEKTDGLFGGAVWNDLYQGLLAGEGLTTELQKLNNVWLQHSALGLEATRTVSLADLRGEASGSLSEIISTILENGTDSASNGVLKLENGIFSATLDMSKLGLEESYNDKVSRRFIKSISVTLPTLLGPYQDIEATLSSAGQMAALSHGMQDAGRFVTNFDDSRFLPFEGMELKKGSSTALTLSIFNVKRTDEAAPNQRTIVDNLSDIIFHIHYILR